MTKSYDFSPTSFHYTFGPHEPVLRLHVGDKVSTTTDDMTCLDSEGKNKQNVEIRTLTGESNSKANTLVGPFYIEEAQFGDTLVIDLLEIRPNQNFACSKHKPGFGALGIEDFDFGLRWFW